MDYGTANRTKGESMQPIDLGKIPESMKQERRWVSWHAVERNGKVTKVPYCPLDLTGIRKASTNKPETWGTLEEATTHADKCNKTGIGFVLTGEYTGVDLDHVRNPETGEFTKEACDIMSQLNTYTELSPSGTGVHMIMHTDYTHERKKTILAEGADGAACSEIEIYTPDSARYFTVTGNRIGNADVRECTDTLRAVANKYLPVEKRASTVAHTNTKKPATVASVPVCTNDNMTGGVYKETLTANETWNRIRESKHGVDIMSLAGGDLSKFPGGDKDPSGDRSRAVMSLVSHLAYWTGNDSVLMDEMFRQTSLYTLYAEQNGRPIWDRVYGNGETYADRTIRKAIDWNVAYGTPFFVSSTAAKNVAPNSAANSIAPNSSLSQSVHSDTATIEGEGLNLLESPRTMTKGEYGRKYYSGDAENFAQFKDRTTGWGPLDEVHGAFLPGLYTIGAVTSLGKTTFCLQMADYLATHEKCEVLYFSVEQSPFELYTKGLARVAFLKELGGYCKPQEKIYNAPLAQHFRYGLPEYPDDVCKVVDAYNADSDHFTIIDCGFALTAGTIKTTVEAFIKKHPLSPIVIFVDYIQAVLPDTPQMSERQTVDNTVRTLKQLNRDYPGLTIVAVSSINRAAYLLPITMESFKESGGVEFTSDVVWGLELGIMSDPLFKTEGKEVLRKRNILDAAKRATPREVRLRCLKNRNGAPTYECPFYYYPAHDFFYALEKPDLTADGEYPLTQENHWRGMLAPTSDKVTTETVVGTISLSPDEIIKLEPHFAKKVYLGIMPPEERESIEHLNPNEAKAQLLFELGGQTRSFSRYSDFPDWAGRSIDPKQLNF